jgi:hypothetical protein
MSLVVALKPDCVGDGSGVHWASPDAERPPTLMPPYNPVQVESADNKGLAPRSAAWARCAGPNWAKPRLAIAASDPTTAFFISTLFRPPAPQPLSPSKTPSGDLYGIGVAKDGLSDNFLREGDRAEFDPRWDAGRGPASLGRHGGGCFVDRNREDGQLPVQR